MQQRYLRRIDKAPTVYLIDEYHHCGECTSDNIAIAKRLFHDDVVIAGVEGYEGGLEYDDYDHRYRTTRCNATLSEGSRISDYPDFANALQACGLLVVGVDCRGLANEIEADVADGNCEPGKISDHRNQRRRSEHFVRTLFEEARNRHIEGSLILNCGANHNAHIEEIVTGGGDLPAQWANYSFVRIRSDYFAHCK